MGDIAQLPPVGDKVLYHNKPHGALATEGYWIYHKFETVVQLLTNQRAAGSSKEQQHFRQLQNNARDGNSTTDDWKCLLTRTPSSLSEIVTFLISAVKLCLGNDKVANDNYKSLVNLDQPVAVINAKHSNAAAAKLPADDMGGLHPRLLLNKDSKVMLTRNL